jgi:hypothetical protein
VVADTTEIVIGDGSELDFAANTRPFFAVRRQVCDRLLYLSLCSGSESQDVSDLLATFL